MKDIKINKLQRDRNHWRYEAHKNPTDKNWGAYRESRNKIKKAIKQIWKVICIINQNISTLQEDPCALNEFFDKTAERPVGQNATTDDVILSYINSLTSSNDSFKLQKVTYNDVLKSLKSL